MALRIALSVFAVLLLLPGAALADDWTAERLRGRVFQLVQGEWQVLQRGDIVPDDRVLRTTRGGRVKLSRGRETIELGGDTQIQIVDRTGRKFTNVTQYFGQVEIEAEVQNVEHFAVRTPFMAAVVKGTKFIVRSDKTTSKLDVLRGRVAVKSERTRSTTLVSEGQSVSAAADAELVVAGKGELPMIVTANGVAHRPADLAAKAMAGNAKMLAREARRLADIAARAVGKEKKAAEKAARAALKKARDAEKQAAQASQEQAKETRKTDSKTQDTAKSVEKAADKSGQAIEQAAGNAGMEAGKSAEKAEEAQEKATKEVEQAVDKAEKAAGKSGK